MPETREDTLRRLGSISLRGVTDEDLERLKNALHREETAIKWLTAVLTVFTFVLVLRGIEALRHVP